MRKSADSKYYNSHLIIYNAVHKERIMRENVSSHYALLCTYITQTNSCKLHGNIIFGSNLINLLGVYSHGCQCHQLEELSSICIKSYFHFLLNPIANSSVVEIDQQSVLLLQGLIALRVKLNLIQYLTNFTDDNQCQYY